VAAVVDRHQVGHSSERFERNDGVVFGLDHQERNANAAQKTARRLCPVVLRRVAEPESGRREQLIEFAQSANRSQAVERKAGFGEVTDAALQPADKSPLISPISRLRQAPGRSLQIDGRGCGANTGQQPVRAFPQFPGQFENDVAAQRKTGGDHWPAALGSQHL